MEALSALSALTSEAAHSEGGVSPFVVGGGILLALVVLLLAVVAFGGGREHS